ncbi:MAG: hypothetical protein IJO22_05290 [Oscillospiraceae bacterium]|nr:hypothetical protein [Oscillospiraceae bacterium]
MTQWIITSSVLILIIAVLRFVLRGKISLKLQYALWGLVLIRLLLPFSVFESPASVLNLMKEREETFEPPVYYEPYAPGTINPGVPDNDIYILDDYVEQIAPETNITIDKEGFVTEPEIKVFDWGDVLMGVWLVGTAVFGAVFAVSNFRFRKKLKNTREYVSGTKAWLPVYESSAIKTPCLFGAAKPAIYVTKGVLGDEKVLSHVLEHETTHYRHGDHVWSVLRCFCLALHWYNPLVWLAAFLSMRDSELACDEDTIKRIGEEERIGYGRTLINLTCEKPAVGILSAATTMTGSKSSIKERIMLIAKKPKMLKITAALVAVIAVFAVGCTFTGAVVYNPKTTENPVSETYSNVFYENYSDIDKTVKMGVTSASSEEITTEIINGTSDNIVYSTGYKLHFEQNGKWYELPVLGEKTSDMMFAGSAIKTVPSNGEKYYFENETKESYGKLPDGKYRILRTFEYRGVSENPEAESFILAAEFFLKDGKLSPEYPAKLENGEYVPVEQIFMNFSSSFFGIPDEKYRITDDAFVILNSKTGLEIENYPVSEWKWQEIPYSAEEWKNLFIATETIPFPDISEYRSRYYQPLDDGKFIASLDGELWLVEIGPKKMSAPNDLWVWDIYRILPGEESENSSYQKRYYRIYSEKELSAMTEEEYKNAAKIMGYTDEQLDYIEPFFEEGLTRAHVLMPLEMSKENSLKTSVAETEKVLGFFFFDPEVFADYEGPLGFAYKIYRDHFRIVPEILSSSVDYGIIGTFDYVFADSEGVRFYDFTQLYGPYLTWEIPKQEGEHNYGYWQLGVSICENTGNVVIFYADIPDDFDVIYEGREPDLSSTYQICILNSAGYEINFDTGINLMVEFEGLPDCVRPDYIRDDGKTVLFTLGGKSYIFDYEKKNNLTIKEISSRGTVHVSSEFYGLPESFGTEWNIPKNILRNPDYNPILHVETEQGRTCIFWIDRPEDFVEGAKAQPSDKTATYKLTVLAENKREIGTYDTGIPLQRKYGGLDGDCAVPDIISSEGAYVSYKIALLSGGMNVQTGELGESNIQTGGVYAAIGENEKYGAVATDGKIFTEAEYDFYEYYEENIIFGKRLSDGTEERDVFSSETFKMLNASKESEILKKYDSEKKAGLKNAKIGDTVTFGSYHGSSKWKVLDKNGEKLLLISEKCLDAMPYNTERTDITWENSSIRAWLNGEFAQKAFSAKEFSAVASTKLDNPKNTRFGGAKGGNDTVDKVFLLSYDEANKYFPAEDEQVAGMTGYARNKEIWYNTFRVEEGPSWWWWLRSPGLGQDMASIFYCNEKLLSGGPANDGLPVDTICAIRPAIWVDTSKI